MWQEGKEAPPELSSLSIFDARCADAYLDHEGDFSYVPYGLHVFEALAGLCQQFKTRIEAEQQQSKPDLSAFERLRGETSVGKLIAALSAKTTAAQIQALTLLAPEEVERREALERPSSS